MPLFVKDLESILFRSIKFVANTGPLLSDCVVIRWGSRWIFEQKKTELSDGIGFGSHKQSQQGKKVHFGGSRHCF